MALKVFLSALVICVVVSNSKGCDMGPVRECVLSIPGIQSIQEAAESSPDPNDIVSAISNIDACVTFPQVKECLQNVPKECLENVPDSLENFLLEEVFSSLGESETCEAISLYAKGFESIYGCLEKYAETEQAKEEEKLVNFVGRTVVAAHGTICCALKKASLSSKDTYFETCDDLSRSVLTHLDKESDKFLDKVCGEIEADSDYCKAVLAEV